MKGMEQQGSPIPAMICKLVFIAGWLALFGIYAFSNPDMVTPVVGEANPNAGLDDNNNPIPFTEEEAKGPVHCAVEATLDETLMVTCKACYFPYTACEETDKTPAWMMLFLFGFIVNAIPIITTIIGCAAAKDPMGSAAKCAGLFVCINCIGSLCWIITAVAFRFSYAGNAVSGTPIMVVPDFSGVGVGGFGEIISNVADQTQANAENMLENGSCGVNGEMCSSGLLILVLCILWFVGMGCCCLTCIISCICCKEKLEAAQAMAKGNMGMQQPAM
jgi:hypothetical protein